MNKPALLKKTIALAKTGDKEAFENLYILTVQDTSAKICHTVRNNKVADDLLVYTYVMVYSHVEELPSEEDALEAQIEAAISQIAYNKYGIEIQDFRLGEEVISISEEWAATLWIRIEEKIIFKKTEPKEEKTLFTSDIYTAGKIVLSIIMLLLTFVILYMGWNRWSDRRDAASSNAESVSQIVESTPATELMIGLDQIQPGWEQRSDGKLYYVKNDGTIADKTLDIGKQQLTFSSTGELVLITNNQAVSENPFLSFNEDVCYEVQGGDIYKKNGANSGSDVRVVTNGHVVQADARCGFLWYICKYQVPNSEQVRTTIYRSDLNGENQQELYTTNNTLKTESFQLTTDWMYYISDGVLLRKNLHMDSVQALADEVEYYFAWENTAYYMNGRTLESVSQGIGYSGVEAGYKIELEENGLVLYDAMGEIVTPDENGEKQVGDRVYRIAGGVIISTRPSDREDGGVTYYIDSTGSTNKIYSKNSQESRGLIQQEGLSVDSLCLAGEWLYYSARITEFGAEAASQIYRLNLQTLELESVGDRFWGYMKDLYYFDNLQLIFGEYIPSAADPNDIHGMVSVISIGGNPQVIDDTAVRPESEGSDMLEIVMADGNRLYCIYHEYDYNSETGELETKSSRPIELPFYVAGVR